VALMAAIAGPALREWKDEKRLRESITPGGNNKEGELKLRLANSHRAPPREARLPQYLFASFPVAANFKNRKAI
jgi:hypothetical protein